MSPSPSTDVVVLVATVSEACRIDILNKVRELSSDTVYVCITDKLQGVAISDFNTLVSQCYNRACRVQENLFRFVFQPLDTTMSSSQLVQQVLNVDPITTAGPRQLLYRYTGTFPDPGILRLLPGDRVQAVGITLTTDIDSNDNQDPITVPCASMGSTPIYNNVVIGGTFDHLHDGHRVLLTTSCMLANQRLTIGLADGPLLRSKKYKEFMESFEDRKQYLEHFIRLIRPGIHADIHQLHDPCGPATEQEDLQAIVLSPETIKGGEYINNIRREKGLSQLVVVVIDFVEDDRLGDTKLSSTTMRWQARQQYYATHAALFLLAYTLLMFK